MNISTKNDIYKLRFALDNAPAFIYMKNTKLQYIYANKPTLKLFKCTSEALIGKMDEDFFPQQTIEKLRTIDAQVLQGISTEEEVFVLDNDGHTNVYLEKKTPIYENENSKKIVGILGISTDISKRKAMEEELHNAAMKDYLTGIANRRYIVNKIESSIEKKQDKSHCAILFLDLNKFKQLNDTYGHNIGDAVLIEVAKRLQNSIRKTDTCARIGGDEFIVFIENLHEDKIKAHDEVLNIIETIKTHLSEIFVIEDRSLEILTSIGLTTFCDGCLSVDELLQEADKSMYKAKHKN